MPYTDNRMQHHFAPITMAITFTLFVLTRMSDWIFMYEPTVKVVTTYGSALVLVITTVVQGVRWWFKYRHAKQIKAGRKGYLK